MRSSGKIIDKVWEDWEKHYTKTGMPDRSNNGDVAEWAVRNYLVSLLNVYPCNFCGEWFPHESALCIHLMDAHGTKIIDTDVEWKAGYTEYYNGYMVYKPNNTLRPTITKEEE